MKIGKDALPDDRLDIPPIFDRRPSKTEKTVNPPVENPAPSQTNAQNDNIDPLSVDGPAEQRTEGPSAETGAGKASNDNHPKRYVPTREVKAAVLGQERQVLLSIGVSLNTTATHIRCPYTDHDDKNPSWRWDNDKAIAHCTCTEKPLSIFDVVMRIEGVDFDAAKIRVAETIGRQDLIRTGSKNDEKKKHRKIYQRTDAQSLLNPPADNRDDGIPIRYLASRLGVNESEVPTPATKMVGILEADYWDPTGDKPESLGKFPCLVAETISADGRTHAHRIYLSSDGRNKADLGKRNDPKKSAKKVKKDGKISGCSVIWGNADTAQWIILCEGIETAAAVAFSFAKEIASGDTVVAAAISANGIKAFEAWPNTKSVTVAADRDEGDVKDALIGEKAARAFCLKNQESIDVAIALPGEKKTKCDFLDLLLAKGAEAVRSCVFAAEPYIATEADVELLNRRVRLNIGSDVEIAGRLREKLLDQYDGDFTACDGAFWAYQGAVWSQISGNQIRRKVHEYDGANYDGEPGVVKLTKGKVDSIINELRTMLDEPDFFVGAATGIPCKSGFISFDDEGRSSLEPHSPDHRCRHLIEANWPVEFSSAQKTGSLLYRLLNGSFLGDQDADAKINLLAEVAGAATLGYATRLIKPKAIVLKGESAENGKSQILDLMRGMLPNEAISAMQMGKLGDERYVCHLVGKLLNASDELTSAAAVASDAFKSVITGEPIAARDVYRQAVTFRPIAQHIYATNDLPSFKGGMDRGVQRRLLVVTFNRTIPEPERIEHIGSRIAAEEIDLLLDWVVEGASRLIKQGHFSEPPSSREALREWLSGSDVVLAWLEECVEIETGDNPTKTLSRVAYADFKNWAFSEGYREAIFPAINNFTRRVVGAGKGIGKYRDSQGRYLVGLKILTPQSASYRAH